MKKILSVLIMLLAVMAMGILKDIVFESRGHSMIISGEAKTTIENENLSINETNSGNNCAIEITEDTTYSNVAIHLSNISAESVFKITSGALILNNVTITMESCSLNTIISNINGSVELDNVVFPKLGSNKNYIISTSNNNITIHNITDSRISRVLLVQGAIVVNDDTNINNKITIDLGFDDYNDIRFDDMVGRVLVRGKNTFARYFQSYFELKSAWNDDDTDYKYYMDFVGDIGDDISDLDDGFQLQLRYADAYSDSSDDSAKLQYTETLKTGDLIFTKFCLKYNNIYYAGRYCTGDLYLKNNTCRDIKTYIISNKAKSESTVTFYLDNHTAIAGSTSGNIVLGSNGNADTIQVTVKKYKNDEYIDEDILEGFGKGAKRDILIDLTNCTFDSASVISGNNVNVSNKLAGNVALLTVDTNNDSTNATIRVDLTESNEDSRPEYTLITPSESLIYNGQNRLDDIIPYYMLDEEKINLSADELDIYKLNGSEEVSVSEICTAGEYVIKINTNDSCDYSTYEYFVTILPKDITVEFSNDIHEYNGTAQSLSATLVGVCEDDSVEIIYSNNSLTTPGSVSVGVSISDNNYNLTGTTTHTLEITVRTIDMSGVKFENASFVYAPDMVRNVEATNVPSEVEVTYVGNGKTNVKRDGNGNVVGYTVEANFSVKDSSLYRIENADKKKSCTLTITPKIVDMSVISVPSRIDHVYDGKAVNITYTGTLPKQVTSTYYYYKDVGGTEEYRVFAPVNAIDTFYPAYVLFMTNDRNYQLSQNQFNVDIYISRKLFDLSLVTFANETVEYDGENHGCIATTTSNVVEFDYKSDKKCNVGTYEQEVGVYTINNNYYLPENTTLTATLTINPKLIYSPNIFFANDSFVYENGVNRILNISGTLPDGVSVNYEYYLNDVLVSTTGVENAGQYIVWARFSSEIYSAPNYELMSDLSASLTITKAIIDMSMSSFSDIDVEYDGEPHSIVISNLPNNVTATYSNSDLISIGKYTITATLHYDEDNYSLSHVCGLSATLNITKASYDMSGITFSNITVTYDGLEHIALITGELPSTLVAKYQSNARTHAGTQTAFVTFENKDSNYNDVDGMSCQISIQKKTVLVSLLENTFEYSGSPYTVVGVVNGAIDGEEITVNLSNTTNTNAGVYYATVLGFSSNDYIAVNSALQYTIEKANISFDDFSFEDGIYVYDGMDHSPVFRGTLPNGVLVNVQAVEMINVGQYTSYANFSVLNGNYNTPSSLEAHTQILPKTILVKFSDYTGLIADGTEKSIGVSFVGVVENDFDGYTLQYNARPIGAGKYTCSVILNANSNYQILSGNSIDFEIMRDTIIYLSDDKEVTIVGDGFSSDSVVSLNEINDRSVINKINGLDINIKNYEAFQIDIDDDTHQELQISLKSGSLNVHNSKYLRVYKVVDGELKQIEYNISGESIEFSARVDDQIIIIESENVLTNNLIVSIFIIVFSGISLIGILVFLFRFVVYKKKYGVKFIEIQK